jgi:diadenosine tetraphosphate (Ap4A) HIT family hydrolase
MSNFVVDKRIQDSSFLLGEWPLSSLYLKNDADFPWVILVPRESHVEEIFQLSKTNQNQLIAEITAISQLMKTYFKPDKLNVGALGNIVAQLHVHVVARYKTDKMWPHGVWQPNSQATAYNPAILDNLLKALSSEIASINPQ